jgi:hypothetical protein
MRYVVPCLAFLAAAAPVAAEESHHAFCTERPGLGTSACTLAAGEVAVEAGAGWEYASRDGEREDAFRISDLTVRAGLGAATEVQIGLTALGRVRIRDEHHHSIEHETDAGDLFFGLRHQFVESHGVEAAVQLFATAPTGGNLFGAGDWGAGLVVPLGFELGHGVAFELSPQIEAAVDADRGGRHLAYGSVAGFGLELSETLEAEVELAAFRN